MTSFIGPMIMFALIFLMTGIVSLTIVLKSRKKLKTLYPESYAYVKAEFDSRTFRLPLILSIIGIIVSVLPLFWGTR
jgi:uncharacterized membrane protein